MFDLLENTSLNENIPRDLVRAYRKISAKNGRYPSQRHPESVHDEISDASSARRYATYAYGDAYYKEVTPEEALRNIAADPHYCEKLRILYDGNLVEYEVRDNGQKYAIYGSSTPVIIDGHQYKNIRFAPWRKVIETADKIYETDEYDHVIDAKDRAARVDRSSLRKVRHYSGLGNVNHAAHQPYSNFTTDYELALAEPDTGAHIPSSRYAYGSAGSGNRSSTYRGYLDRLNAAKMFKDEYTRYRKALDKLERERDEYDEDEYQELKDRWTLYKDDSLRRYEEARREASIAKQSLNLVIDQATNEHQRKIAQQLQTIEELLTKCFKCQQTLDTLQNVISSKDTFVRGSIDYRRTKEDLDYRIRKLNRIKTELEQMQATDAENAETLHTALNNEDREFLTTAEEKIFDDLMAIESVRNSSVERHLNAIAAEKASLAAAEKKLAELTPKLTAARAARAAKSKKPELDDKLKNIIVFDGEDDEEETTSEETTSNDGLQIVDD